MSFLDEGTFVGKGAVQDALKDPEFKALKSDEKAKALKTLKIGGSITTEKKGKDLDGDGDIDSKDYLAARNAAIKKAKSMKEGVAKDLYIKAMESSSLEEFLSDVYQDYPQHKGNNDIANYLKNYYLDAGGPIDEGKVKDFLKGAALLAALIGLNKAASENIYKSDPKIKALTSKYEKAEKEGDKKAMADFKKEIEKRKLQWDTGKINEADLGSKIGDALFGKSYDRPFSNLMDTIKDLLKKDKTTSSSDDSKLILKIAAIEKGNLPEKEFKFVLEKLKKTGMSREELKELTKRYKAAKAKSKNSMKEDKKTVELPADTTFTLDLKHLMKKHLDEGKSQEDVIKLTKALMKKLHDKGEVKVDGTKVTFRENKTNEASIMGVPLESFADYYTALELAKNIGVPVVAFSALLAIMGVQKATEFLKRGKETVMAWYEQNKLNEQEDAQLALPEPDAPDYLGDDGMDYEGGMAKSQMLKMKKYAMALCDMVDDESQLEAWVQAKITKASDYMSAVYHYLDYQKSRMNELNEDEGQNIADFLNANYKEVASKLGNPGSNFEIIGDNKVATAGDGNEGIDISFDKNHMDKLFPKDDPYNEVKELTIAGKVVYYNDYRGSKMNEEEEFKPLTKQEKDSLVKNGKLEKSELAAYEKFLKDNPDLPDSMPKAIKAFKAKK